MIVEQGVELKGLCKQIKDVIPIIRVVFLECHETLTIRSTRWGMDRFNESHEKGLAIDIGRPLVLTSTVFLKIKDALGINYVCKDMKNIIHIEYSPIGNHALPKTDDEKRDGSGDPPSLHGMDRPATFRTNHKTIAPGNHRKKTRN